METTTYKMAVEKVSALRTGSSMEKTADVKSLMRVMARILLRTPWLTGFTAAFFLEIGLFRAGRTSGAGAAKYWLEGAFYQSYVAASLLVYATLAAVIQIPVLGFRTLVRKPTSRPDLKRFAQAVSGLLLILVFMCILWQFHYCFIHKTKGYVIWPLVRW
jgi:hypothetical protein